MSERIESGLLRLIDANLNRLREGVRVVEDIFRYIYNDQEIASLLKNIRHKTRTNFENEILPHRDIKKDVLKETTKSELQRSNLKDIVKANLKRAQESARVLEESMKIIDIHESENFKQIRYELYHLEQLIFEKII